LVVGLDDGAVVVGLDDGVVAEGLDVGDKVGEPEVSFVLE